MAVIAAGWAAAACREQEGNWPAAGFAETETYPLSAASLATTLLALVDKQRCLTNRITRIPLQCTLATGGRLPTCPEWDHILHS